MSNIESSVDWLLSNISSKIDNEYWCNQKEITEFVEQAKEMELIGKETSYADGYKEGYNRAIELTKWTISNLIPPPL
jgi:flagellar biosynthesis/type III secretory pathway protein FliH